MGYTKLFGIGDSFDFGGTFKSVIEITTVPGIKSLGNVDLPTLDNAIKCVFIDLMIARIRNSSAVGNNDMSAASTIETSGYGVASTAISVPEHALTLQPSETASGARFIGSTNVKANFVSGGTTNFRWMAAVAARDTLTAYDAQCVARVILE